MRMFYILLYVMCFFSFSAFAHDNEHEIKRYNLNLFDCTPGAWDGWRLKYDLNNLQKLYPGLLCPHPEGYGFLESEGYPYFEKIQYKSYHYLCNTVSGKNKYRIVPALKNNTDNLMRFISNDQKISTGTYFFSRSHNQTPHPFNIAFKDDYLTAVLDSFFIQLHEDTWSIGLPARKHAYGIHLYKCSPDIVQEKNKISAMKWMWYALPDEDMRFYPIEKNQEFIFTGSFGTYVIFNSMGDYLLLTIEPELQQSSQL